MAGVYLLHIAPPYKHAAHYTGYADDVERRIIEHRAGHGARLTQVAVQAGCELRLARVWPDANRAFERRLKNYKKPTRFCPLCRGEAAHTAMRGVSRE